MNVFEACFLFSASLPCFDWYRTYRLKMRRSFSWMDTCIVKGKGTVSRCANGLQNEGMQRSLGTSGSIWRSWKYRQILSAKAFFHFALRLE